MTRSRLDEFIHRDDVAATMDALGSLGSEVVSWLRAASGIAGMDRSLVRRYLSR